MLLLYVAWAEPFKQKGDVPGSWRYVVSISGFISVLQILTSQTISVSSEEHSRLTQPSASDPGSQSHSQLHDEGKHTSFTFISVTYL